MSLENNEKKVDMEQQSAPSQPVKKNRPFWKRILPILLFIAVFLCTAFFVTDVVRQKWPFSSNAAQQIVQGFYKEKEQSIDVLCLGASTIRNGISELEMFHEYGFTTYSRATSIQLPMMSYYLLQETLQTQDIKAVVMDATAMMNTFLDRSDGSLAGKLHEAVDYMPWSSFRTDMIREVMKLDDSIEFTDFVVPIYAYHDRWQELTKDDFIYRQWQTEYCFKGQNPSISRVTVTNPADYMISEETEENSIWIDDSLEIYMDKMIQLCKERNIQFVLVKMPNISWSNYKHNLVQNYADEKGVSFIDYNLASVQEKIGYDPQTDYVDRGMHPNLRGANKISSYLGEYLMSVCDFTDKRELPEYASWQKDYETYQCVEKNYEIVNETNLISFLEKLQNPDYFTVIATRDDTSVYYNDDVAKAFEALGVEAPFAEYPCVSYIGLIDDGKIVNQIWDLDPYDYDSLITYDTEYEGHIISVSSFANRLTNNEASIYLDGESVCPNGKGFNFAVYDKVTNQVIAKKYFNIGLDGKNYTPVNEFTELRKDPAAFLGMLADNDYISVIGVSGDALRFIPGEVNQKLISLGLRPLEGEFNQPYIAILDGGHVVYHEEGEADSEISTERNVGNVPVTVVSKGGKSPSCFVSFGEDSLKTALAGMFIRVYSKSQEEVVTSIRFTWSDNYVTDRSYGKISNIKELLDAVKSEKNDVICIYSPDLAKDGIPEDAVESLRAFGFSNLDVEGYYAGAVLANGSVLEQADHQPVSLNYERKWKNEEAGEGEENTWFIERETEFRLLADGNENTASVGDVAYTAGKDGLYVIVYNAEHDAVLTEKYFSVEAESSPFEDVKNDPVAFLDMMKDEDYISVIGVTVEGTKYIPGTVNDKLAEMGLQPLDGGFNRPYLAILEGDRIVYNAYGETGETLSTMLEVSNVSVAAVSSASGKNGYFYASVNGNELKSASVGVVLCVYSKSENKLVGTRRFNWSNSVGLPATYSGVSNIYELLSLIRKNKNDLLCVYNPENAPNGVPEEALEALRQFGLDELAEGQYYVGYMSAGGEKLQKSGEDAAKLLLEGVEESLELYASGEGSGVRKDGTEYATSSAGLHLLVYHGEQKAIVAEKYYAKAAVPSVNVFNAYASDPNACLDLMQDEDYISVIGVSVEGSRYIPGVFNDRLKEMGLLPLEREFNCPYLAILDGGRIIYNAYGEVGESVSTMLEAAGVSVAAVSSANAKNGYFYMAVNGKELKATAAGVVLCVYSKSEDKLAGSRRFNWAGMSGYGGLTNIYELLTKVKNDGNDLLCVYAPGNAPNGVPADVISALSQYGLDEADSRQCYAGYVTADGEKHQVHGAEDAQTRLEKNGDALELFAADKKSGVRKNGVEYPTSAAGLHLLVYSPEQRAIVGEYTYANAEKADVNLFEAVSSDPVACLDLMKDDDYISVIGVSMDGTRYIPGIFNDQLKEMGLLPLDQQFNQPYIAILDGDRVVYNASGEAGKTISTTLEVANVAVTATSNANAKKGNFFISINGNEVKSTNQGVVLYIYSKTEDKIIGRRRFNWSNAAGTSAGYSSVSNIYELLTKVRNDGNDLLCVFCPENAPGGVPEEALTALRQIGLDELDGSQYYAGYLTAKSGKLQHHTAEGAAVQLEGNGEMLELFASKEGSGVRKEGSAYLSLSPGIHLLVYNPSQKAIVAENYYANPKP